MCDCPCQNGLEFSMARGDLSSFPFAVYLDEELDQTSMDEIYFTVKKHFYDPEPLFQKTLSDGDIEDLGGGNYLITILPEETENLPFGKYDFDIEVVRLPEIKKTFNGTLELTKESTHARNEHPDGSSSFIGKLADGMKF